MDQNIRQPPRSLKKSIDQVVRIEQQAAQRRTRSEAAVERFVAFVGTMPFVVIHVVLIAVWIPLNAGVVPGVHPFDPYPFGLLATVVSFESVVLTALVLMTQQRMNVLSDRRDHLDLQVNLLTERETTQVLRLLNRIAERLDVHDEVTAEARELAEPTSVEAVVGALHERIPDEC